MERAFSSVIGTTQAVPMACQRAAPVSMIAPRWPAARHAAAALVRADSGSTSFALRRNAGAVVGRSV